MSQQLVQETTDQPVASSAAEGNLSEPGPPALLGIAFVLLWSSGYPAARIALNHSGPFTLLVLRFGGAALVFAALAGFGGVAWPRGRAALHSALVGTLQLGLQFGSLYWAAAQGVSVGLIALVIGTMPIITALLGRALFREEVYRHQWLGFALGFVGVALAVGENVAPDAGAGAGAYLAVLAGLVAVSVGTLYQKRHASNVDPRGGLAVQHLAATLLLLPFAAHEGFRADMSAAFFGSLGWVIGVNSLTTFALLFVLLRRGLVTQVATLFFLMPSATALIDYLVLGDALTAYKVAGMALAALGVYLATRPRTESGARLATPRSAVLRHDLRAARRRARLKDGRRVLIRPIRPADLDALKRFFAALSPAISRLRFLGTIKEVPERLLHEFTRPDQRQHFGIVAEADGRSPEGGPLLVAEARYIRYPGSDAAEFALVVADGWRHVGLGSLLMQTLLRQARLAGVQRLCGDAFTDNEAIRRLVCAHGAGPLDRRESTATVRLCVGTRQRSAAADSPRIVG
jgi:drug/metabolite transporter (DMT)-like permease/GNAT superfamily N-acetyltransferase